MKTIRRFVFVFSFLFFFSVSIHVAQTTKQETATQPPTVSQQQRPIKTITNLDLESYRIKREKDEAAYEQNRVAKGFPSREELQKRNEEELKNLKELSRQQAEAESYWRSRANALRTEIFALDAEMAYVRARINEEPVYTVFHSFVPSQQNMNTNPNVVVEPSANASAQINFGGGRTRASVGFYYQGSSVSFYPNNGIDVYGFYPFYGYAFPFPIRYQSYNRVQLISRLQSLEQARVGLAARWQLLEDEARRAGAQPGWLR
jgi:hypothetical protein